MGGMARSLTEPLDKRRDVGKARYAIIGHLIQMFSATTHQPVELGRPNIERPVADVAAVRWIQATWKP